MPKIIESLKETILEKAKKTLLSDGYKKLNIRDLAKECGTASGTIYNYFPSKDYLIASILLEDWMEMLEAAKKDVEASKDLKSSLLVIYVQILSFYETYRSLFMDYSSNGAYAVSKRHDELIGQVKSLLSLAFLKFDKKIDDETLSFIAENFLNYCSRSKEFEKLYPIINKLL